MPRLRHVGNRVSPFSLGNKPYMLRCRIFLHQRNCLTLFRPRNSDFPSIGTEVAWLFADANELDVELRMKISESPEICRARALRNWRYGPASPAGDEQASQGSIGNADGAGVSGETRMDDAAASAQGAIIG